MDDKDLARIFVRNFSEESSTGLSVEDYRYFLDEIADGLYIADTTGILQYANRPFARILNQPEPKALTGRRLSEFTEPEFRDTLRQIYTKAAISDNEIFRTVVQIRRPDDTRAWIEVCVKKTVKDLAFTGFNGIVRDITEQRTALDALKANEARYHSIVEMSPDAIVTIQTDGSISTANAQALNLFGYETLPELQACNTFDLIHPEEREKADSDLRRVILSGKLHNIEYRLLHKNGSSFWAEVSGNLIPAAGDKPGGILVTARDISKRKSMEENLRNLSVTDELTGVYNRRGFSLAAEQELKHAHRTKNGVVLLFFDMDKLKAINDSFGHAEGDEALKAVATVLHSTFRESDIIGRWGGDEFVVLALDVPEGSIAMMKQRLEENLARRNISEGTRYPISFSTGMSCYNHDKPLTLNEMVRLADDDMYGKKLKK